MWKYSFKKATVNLSLKLAFLIDLKSWLNALSSNNKLSKNVALLPKGPFAILALNVARIQNLTRNLSFNPCLVFILLFQFKKCCLGCESLQNKIMVLTVIEVTLITTQS